MEWQQLILSNSNPLKKKFLKLHFFYVAAILALFWASFLQAEVITWSDPASATFVRKGSYIRVGLSKNGTLGVGSVTKLGLQYDTILVTKSGGITQSWNPTIGVLTLSGYGTVSTYTAILRSAYFLLLECGDICFFMKRLRDVVSHPFDPKE